MYSKLSEEVAVRRNTPSSNRSNTTVQSQKAETAYFSSKQLLPFDFAE